MISLIMVLLIGSLSFTGIVNAENNKKMKRMKIRGTVERVEGREAVILTPQGKQVRVMIGPESYWTYRGYRLVPGQNVSVYGWYPEDRNDSFYAGKIVGSGFTYGLTSSAGTPYWVVQEGQNRTVPSYVVYRDWYGPKYNYDPPPRRADVKKVPPGHRAKAHHDNRRR
jgi:hypothetical protein